MKLSATLLLAGATATGAFAPTSFVGRSSTPLNVAVGDSLPSVELFQVCTAAAGSLCVVHVSWCCCYLPLCTDIIPSLCLLQGFPDVEKVNIADYAKGKNMIIVGLPGAFTPT